ncbi:MAG: alpha-amylase family glycosyl hydrolase [Nocardioides sp.]
MSPESWSWSSRDQIAPVWPGFHQQLGATWSEESTNFAIWAPEATALWICLFDSDGVETRHQLTEHTLGVWHGAIPGVPLGQLYGVRADGPWDPDHGLRFNPAKLLLDPYARAITGEVQPGTTVTLPYELDHPATASTQDSAPAMPRCVVVDDRFDWGEDRHLRHRWRDSVIYEMHVKGFTKLHNEVPEELRGTYAGLGSPTVINYLRDLGVTAVELLPIHQFFSEPVGQRPRSGQLLGLQLDRILRPACGLFERRWALGGQVAEFKQMVKNFHAADIEVILDVVYNHTAEGGNTGPALLLPRAWTTSASTSDPARSGTATGT